MIKKAMVMAAGVGSRLDPLTQSTPKPLVPILNVPVMDILLGRLKACGIESVIANTHYLAEKIQKRYSKNSPIDINFEYIHEDTLSGTAGGLKKCEHFFDDVDDFIVVSADGLHNANLSEISKAHINSNAIATMVVVEVPQKEVSKYGVVVYSNENKVVEFQEKPSVEEAKSNCINTGIYVFNKRIFNYIPKNQKYDFAKNVFPTLLKTNETINVYRMKDYWSDIGSIEQYIQSNLDCFWGHYEIENTNIIQNKNSTIVIDKNSDINETADFKHVVVVGKNCKLGKNVSLNNVILWDNVIVEDNVSLHNCVVAENTILKTPVQGTDKCWEIIGPNKVMDLIKV